ncbi:fungal-specific transcription factor domain-containing protein [Lentinula aff. lateritia]|uniref:Fungal-specific transcription factor domain-containing protein n=1 Tax=Lentinula aff. lateritia TaxID=2804960 RepID=A0ACC1UD32_9AGAR|nr:fungal-specific transcription factor domain-containing protein [Lentinula aff. lateritia]
MSSRIRALEDALAIFQASVSSERHPLLEDELLKIKFGSEVKDSEDEPAILDFQGTRSTAPGVATSLNRSVDTTTLDAFGTLTLGEEGEMKYFGRSAGSETLILVGLFFQCLSSYSSIQGVHTQAGEKYVDFDEESVARLGSNRDHTQGGSDLPDSSADTTSFPPTFPPTISPVHALSFTEDDKDALPSEVYALAVDYDQGAQSQSPLTVSDLLQHLPTRSRTQTLAQSYFDHASLFFRAMKKDELFNTVLPLLYPSPSSSSAMTNNTPPTGSNPSETQTSMTTSFEGLSSRQLPSPHLLSAIFFILALGSFFDLSAPVRKYVPESQMWFELGRKALICSRGTQHLVVENAHLPERHLTFEDDIHPSNATYSETGKNSTSTFAAPPSSADDTVRALGLMATYCSTSGKKYARDSAWCGMSLAAKVAQGSGLHRDPARWHMDPVTVQRRRALWWEVCASDISHSVALGRPPSIHLSFVDCEFPTDEEATLSDTEGEVMGFWRMKYTFAREGFTPVISTTLTAKSPTYSTIMDLDPLRDFYASQHRTVTMLYLHRSFFAHAMLTHPSNPLMSPFALSFLAAYRAASVIIKAAVHFYDRCPAVVPRVWFLTYHVFSAAMTVGTVVKRSPNSSIAKSALNDLRQALNLFEKLEENADRAYTQYLTKAKGSVSASISKTTAANDTSSSTAASSQAVGDAQGVLDPSSFSKTPIGTDDNELAIWGGKTSLLNGLGKKKKVKGKDTMQNTSSSNGNSPDVPPTSTSSSPNQQLPVPYSSQSGGEETNVNTNSFPPPPPSFHSDNSWNDAIDAQMDFDANIDLSLMLAMNSTTAFPSQMPSQSSSTPMDVNMTDSLLSNFGDVDFGFKLGVGFGAGTTGSRGLLMDMTLEDIGPVGHDQPTSSYHRPKHSISQAAASENQLVLMEYLSETAHPTPAPLLPGGPFSYNHNGTNPNATMDTNTSLPWTDSDIFALSVGQFNAASGSNTGVELGVGESGTRGRESDSRIADLYYRFLNYLASKEGAQNSTGPAISTPFTTSAMSIFPGSTNSSWTGSSVGPFPIPSGEDHNMSFDSLMGSGPPFVTGTLNDQENNIGSHSHRLDPSSPLWNLNLGMDNASTSDPAWTAFMRDLAKSASEEL